MTTTFSDLGLPPSLIHPLEDRGIRDPFPIQEAAIPDALAGRDVSGRAPTGSGKTLAFGLPMLALVPKAKPHRPGALVLAPTRELADQIRKELLPLAKAMDRNIIAVFGGVRYEPQKRELRKGVDVLVATPGRLEDLMEQGVIDLSDAAIVAVDEADRMADMGFLPSVRRILDRTAENRQTLLFSATLDGDVGVLIRRFQTDPVRHEAGTVEPETTEAEHHFWLIDHHDKVQHTADVIESADRSIVFTRTRHGADRLARQLSKIGVNAVAMHGGRSQNQRNRALQSFSKGDAQALIATDVAARGIHIDAVASVVHFDPPADHKDYVHRSGRTARAGASGTVVSLVTHEQRRTVQKLQQQLDLDVPISRPTQIREHRAPRDAEVASNRQKPSHQEASPQGKPSGQQKQRTRNDPPPTGNGAKTVHVSNLPWGATDDDIKRLFRKYGTVHQATVMMDRRGRSKGYGLVDMPFHHAHDAVQGLQRAKLGGRTLKIRMSQPQHQRG
jgi:superfamily II DNA/RNA helicase